MKILKYSVGQLQANCYFLIEDNSCIIIDPGDEGSFLIEEIARKNLKPVAILLTHGHFDHVMAVGEIQASFDIPAYMNVEDMFLIKRLEETAKHFLGYKPAIIPPKITPLTEKLRITSYELRIIQTPGHTPGSCCFYFKSDSMIFTGDTLFKSAIGSYDHSYSNKEKLFQSLRNLKKLPEETEVYPGHGESTLIIDEVV